jgi:Transposase IS116/IS110/IS902 family
LRPKSPDVWRVWDATKRGRAVSTATCWKADVLRVLAFARYIGLAPTPHSSAETNVRIRSARHGNRQLNMAVHRIAVTQIHHAGPGRDYFQRRLAEGDDRHRALRSIKRRLAPVVFKRLHADHRDGNGLRARPLTSPIAVVLMWPKDFNVVATCAQLSAEGTHSITSEAM